MKVLVSFSSSVIWGEHLFSFCSILPFLRIESLLAGISVWPLDTKEGPFGRSCASSGIGCILAMLFYCIFKGSVNIKHQFAVVGVCPQNST